MISEYETLRDIDRRIGELQNTADRNLGALMSEFRQLRTERHYLIGGLRQEILGISSRLKKLEAKAEKPLIDFQTITQNLWFKVAILMVLGASNKELFELVAASFAK